MLKIKSAKIKTPRRKTRKTRKTERKY